MFCCPRPPLTLSDLAETISVLLKSGMDITKMNVIRKKIELGKGGRLAAAAYPAAMCTLVLSDVIGDPLDLIASGPTVPDDGSTWFDAQRLIEQYKLQLPSKVLDMIQSGVNGELEDTPKGCHPMFTATRRSAASTTGSKLSEAILVANNDLAVVASAKEAKRLGYNPVILGTCIDGEAKEVAHVYIALALQLHRQKAEGAQSPFFLAPLPAALIAGGETTVTLPADNQGKGGRNQELGLSAALILQEKNLRGIIVASLGTDGTDGPTDAAGVVVDGGTISRVEQRQEQRGEMTLKGSHALRCHDAYTFFSYEIDKDKDLKCECPSLIKTGPTGTNVADVAVILVR